MGRYKDSKNRDFRGYQKLFSRWVSDGPVTPPETRDSREAEIFNFSYNMSSSWSRLVGLKTRFFVFSKILKFWQIFKTPFLWTHWLHQDHRYKITSISLSRGKYKLIFDIENFFRLYKNFGHFHHIFAVYWPIIFVQNFPKFSKIFQKFFQKFHFFPLFSKFS